jgi:hypothetical protein
MIVACLDVVILTSIQCIFVGNSRNSNRLYTPNDALRNCFDNYKEKDPIKCQVA